MLKKRNILLIIFVLIVFGIVIVNKDYRNISSMFAYFLLFISVKTVLDFSFGLTMRVGYSGEIENLPKYRTIRFLLLLMGLFIGGMGGWWLNR